MALVSNAIQTAETHRGAAPPGCSLLVKDARARDIRIKLERGFGFGGDLRTVILDPVTDSGTTSAEQEEVWLRPSPRLGIMRRVEVFGAAGLAAAIVVVITAVGYVAGAPGSPAVAAVLIIAIALAGFLGDRWAQRRVRAWAYRERDDDLVVRRGVMVSRLSVIPYGRMQFIDVIAGPIERTFGLATVRMHTAAASSDARIPGLTQVEAARLRDHLAQLGEAKSAGL